MNKQEALQKIKELQEYIEECDKKHPDVKLGQLYRRTKNNDVYIVATSAGICHIDEGSFDLVDICYGGKWHTGEGFSGDEDKFEYIGMAKDLISVSKT